MPLVELIYDKECPNVSEARAYLLRAFSELGLRPKWREWDRNSPESPTYARAYGSPTILVDGRDVANVKASEANCCRVYSDPNGRLQGIPSLESIKAALISKASKRASGFLPILAGLPGILLPLLPNVACVGCLPAYLGVFSSLGLGFLVQTQYLLPLTLLFLLIALAVLAFGIKRKGWGPFSLGVVASLFLVIGRFVFASPLAMYTGVALMISSSIWNSWPRKLAKGGSCPACVPGTAAANNLERKQRG